MAAKVLYESRDAVVVRLSQQSDCGNREYILKCQRGGYTMRRTAILLASFAILLTVGATAQEDRSEISLQGTGFFTKGTNGQGISSTTTDTGGFQVGYR
jgi:hypothetical protein